MDQSATTCESRFLYDAVSCVSSYMNDRKHYDLDGERTLAKNLFLAIPYNVRGRKNKSVRNARRSTSK